MLPSIENYRNPEKKLWFFHLVYFFREPKDSTLLEMARGSAGSEVGQLDNTHLLAAGPH